MTVTADLVVQQWIAERGVERRTLPTTSGEWSSTGSHVARYLLSLRALGLDDPTKAHAFYANALTLRDAWNRVEQRA